MKLKILRTRILPTRTIGQLYVEDEFFCFTLEDVVREVPGQSVERWKIPGSTAIPSGVYSISLETSPRFGPDTITVRAVPGFTGIRIHAGNTEDDTEGCILVGQQLSSDYRILQSRTALNDLKHIVRAAKDSVTLQIVTPT